MFDAEGASIAAPKLFTSFPFPSNPSSSRLDMDYGLSSSSSEPIHEDIHIKEHVQATLEDGTESTPKNINDTTTHPGPSEQ